MNAEYITCRICNQLTELANARAGYQDAQGGVVLICDSHFESIYDLISGWSNFVVEQMTKYSISCE